MYFHLLYQIPESLKTDEPKYLPFNPLSVGCHI